MIRTPCGEEELLGYDQVNDTPAFACCYGGKGKRLMNEGNLFRF